MTKTPRSKLRIEAIVELDLALKELSINQNLSINLYQKFINNQISTSLLTQTLNEISDLQFQKNTLLFTKVFTPEPSKIYLALAFTGFIYTLSQASNNLYLLVRRDAQGHVIESILGASKDITKQAKLTGEVWTVSKKRQVNSLQKSSRDDKNTLEPIDFVMGYFIKGRMQAFKIIGVSIVVTLIGLATPLGFQTFTDKILPYAAQNSLIAIVVLLCLAAIASNVLGCYQSYLQSIFMAKYQNGLGKDVFKRLISMDMSYLNRHKVGDLTKLVGQIEESANFLISQLLGTAIAVISLLVVMPLLFFYNMTLASIVLLIGVLMAATVAVSLKVIRRRTQEAYTYDANFNSSVIEILKGMQTIKALANESYFRRTIGHDLEINLYGAFNVDKLRNIIGAILGFQSQLISIAVIFFGAQAVFANTMTIGELIAFNMLANKVVGPLVSVVMTAAGWETFKLARRKMLELVPPDETLLLADDTINLSGDIEFKDVWFRYPDTEEWVLKGINLKIKQGDIIGIVGGSGSGKSTLAALLMGFYTPDKGKITINGYDVSLISPQRLRSRIASVQQTSFLFNNSVLENIHLGRLNSDFDDIQKALIASGAQEFVNDMPQRYLTEIAEDGMNLSGGQRQRLAIARALIRDADIMLFDEATSALDNETEERIKDTIYKACQGRTGLIIAHRLNTLSYCQRLIVMGHGKIEADGSHHELLEFENSYKRMWESMLKREVIIMGQTIDVEDNNAVQI
ncbi:MAG: peptidase domain-containing ABC transporter [Rhizobiales bacterium]|nr:peptidase domain-containing ABC transporter [Hyphomicrobiales bacterium]